MKRSKRTIEHWQLMAACLMLYDFVALHAASACLRPPRAVASASRPLAAAVRRSRLLALLAIPPFPP